MANSNAKSTANVAHWPPATLVLLCEATAQRKRELYLEGAELREQHSKAFTEVFHKP